MIMRNAKNINKGKMIESSSTKFPPPLMVGNHVALDFLNSVASPNGEPIEWLADGEKLLSWLEHTHLIAQDEALRHFKAANFSDTAEKARNMREEMRRIITDKAAGRLVNAGSSVFNVLNQVLFNENRYAQLDCRHGDYAIHRHFRWQHPDEVLLPLADSIADLICNADFSLVRKCENPKCTLWFYDHTKGHRRRWCTTTICGNRAKVAAHRARKKTSATSF